MYRSEALDNGTDDASCDGPELAMTSSGGRRVPDENPDKVAAGGRRIPRESYCNWILAPFYPDVTQNRCHGLAALHSTFTRQTGSESQTSVGAPLFRVFWFRNEEIYNYVS